MSLFCHIYYFNLVIGGRKNWNLNKLFIFNTIVTSQHAGYRVITREENEKYFHACTLSKRDVTLKKCPGKLIYGINWPWKSVLG